jgi:hypothetical protein
MSEQYQPGSKEEGGGFQLQVNSPQEEERDYSLMLKRWASNDHDKPTNAGAASNMLGIDQLGALTKRKAESSLGGHDRSTYAFSNLGSASKPGSVAADTWFGMDANPPVGSDQISDGELGHPITTMYELPVYGEGSLETDFKTLSEH